MERLAKWISLHTYITLLYMCANIVYTYMRVYMYKYASMYTYTHTHTYIYIYVYTEVHLRPKLDDWIEPAQVDKNNFTHPSPRISDCDATGGYSNAINQQNGIMKQPEQQWGNCAVCAV